MGSDTAIKILYIDSIASDNATLRIHVIYKHTTCVAAGNAQSTFHWIK